LIGDELRWALGAISNQTPNKTENLMRSITLLSLFSFACSNVVPSDVSVEPKKNTNEAAGSGESETGQTGLESESDHSGADTEAGESDQESTEDAPADAGTDTPADEPVDDAPVDEDGDGFTDDVDCDDHDSRIAPGAPEYCDGIDTDCDGVVDPSNALDALTWYRDGDGDGFGDPLDSRTSCGPPGGPWVANSDDCDDFNADINPDAIEICDGLDNDCDGLSDPPTAADAPTWHLDDDADGFGVDTETTVACLQPAGVWTEASGDCDDTDARIHPGAEEFCDGADFDCDGAEAEGIATWFGVGEDAVDVTSHLEAGFFRRTELGRLGVCGGVWNTRLEFDISGLSASMGSSTVVIQGYGDPILDGGDDGRLVLVEGGVSILEIDGLTLKNGEANRGAAIYGMSLDLRLSDMILSSNTTSGSGGAIYIEDGNIELDDVTFRNNMSSGFGAHGGAIRLLEGDIEGANVTFYNNDTAGFGSGGAIAINAGSVTFADALFSQNDATYRGGAVVLFEGDLTLIDSSAAHNSALSGGAFYVGGVVDLEATTVDNNEANFGAGVYLPAMSGAEAVFCSSGGASHSGFLNNQSDNGGAVYAESWWGYRVESMGCDWGTGSNDNESQDIKISTYGEIDAGMNATFDCTATLCLGGADFE
jgi:hypothetical protein